MTVTNIGKSGAAILLAGGTTRPAYIAIGTGSMADGVGITGLNTLLYVKPLTGSDTSTLNKVTWTADFNSVEMSGNSLVEFGLTTGSPAGDLWNYVNLGNGIEFDGSNELRIEITWEVV